MGPTNGSRDQRRTRTGGVRTVELNKWTHSDNGVLQTLEDFEAACGLTAIPKQAE